jgi:hypothetical protein
MNKSEEDSEEGETKFESLRVRGNELDGGGVRAVGVCG